MKKIYTLLILLFTLAVVFPTSDLLAQSWNGAYPFGIQSSGGDPGDVVTPPGGNGTPVYIGLPAAVLDQILEQASVLFSESVATLRVAYRNGELTITRTRGNFYRVTYGGATGVILVGGF